MKPSRAVGAIALVLLSACGPESPSDQPAVESSPATTAPTKFVGEFEDVAAYLNSNGVPFEIATQSIDDALGAICAEVDGQQPRARFKAGVIKAAAGTPIDPIKLWDTTVAGCYATGHSAKWRPIVRVSSSNSCDDEYPLVFLTDPPALVARAKVSNRGNVPVNVTLTAKWFYFSGGYTSLSKELRLAPGRTRSVGFNKPSNLSELQLMIGYQYGDRMCDVTAQAVAAGSP